MRTWYITASFGRRAMYWGQGWKLTFAEATRFPSFDEMLRQFNDYIQTSIRHNESCHRVTFHSYLLEEDK